MKTAIYYHGDDISLYRGWKEGLDDCGVNCYPVSKKFGDMPKSVSKVDLFIVEDPDEVDMQFFEGDYWDGKLVCLVKEYKEFYKNISRINLFVEPVFYDKDTERGFKKNNLPFHYCPMASQESLIPFYTELNREFDVSIDDPLKEPWNTITIPKYSTNPEIIYGNTKVNLNYQIPRKDYVYLNQKAFDIPMSGNFELSTIPQVQEIFEGKVGYTSEPEMRDKIQYYIDHEEERTRMAIKAYEVCIAKHTYTYRMRDLLKKLKS